MKSDNFARSLNILRIGCFLVGDIHNGQRNRGEGWERDFFSKKKCVLGHPTVLVLTVASVPHGTQPRLPLQNAFSDVATLVPTSSRKMVVHHGR